LYTNDEAGQAVGNLFYGSKGFAAGKDLYRTPGTALPDEGEGAAEIVFDNDQYITFLKAVRTRDERYIAGTAEQGHISCAHIHLANIAWRLRRTLKVDPATETIVDDEEANAMLTRAYR